MGDGRRTLRDRCRKWECVSRDSSVRCLASRRRMRCARWRFEVASVTTGVRDRKRRIGADTVAKAGSTTLGLMQHPRIRSEQRRPSLSLIRRTEVARSETPSCESGPENVMCLTLQFRSSCQSRLAAPVRPQRRSFASPPAFPTGPLGPLCSLQVRQVPSSETIFAGLAAPSGPSCQLNEFQAGCQVDARAPPQPQPRVEDNHYARPASNVSSARTCRWVCKSRI
jgi:hypothetical protein